jgi:hypothetical protein
MAEPVPESVLAPYGPLPPVNVTIALPGESGARVSCPSGLSYLQKQRLLRAAKKQINAALTELHKDLNFREELRRLF